MLELIYIKSLLYGGSDGIITIFNILIGLKNIEIPTQNIMLITLIVLFGDAISMALADFNSNIDTEIYKSDYNKIISSIITFCSFIIFGSIPIITYFLMSNKQNIKYSFILSFISFSLLIFISEKMREKKNIWINTIKKVIISLFAIIFTFFFSKYVNYIKNNYMN
jgi:VIT1/CCC1 family predicted Fe2+/Mn2+ transporter